MNTKTTSFLVGALLSTGVFAGSTVDALSQGMPPESRENIHKLFNQHEQIERNVTLTKAGYQATTTSTNPVVIRAIQAHVNQMSTRLKSGLMVRRWDPAFAEYVNYCDDIEHEFAKIPNGIRANVTGKTPEAIRVAQNHAQVIADFAAHGWKAHDQSHPAAIGTTEKETASAHDGTGCANCLAEAGAGKPETGGGCACGRNGKGPGHGRAR
jgi:hypothetical protein